MFICPEPSVDHVIDRGIYATEPFVDAASRSHPACGQYIARAVAIHARQARSVKAPPRGEFRWTAHEIEGLGRVKMRSPVWGAALPFVSFSDELPVAASALHGPHLVHLRLHRDGLRLVVGAPPSWDCPSYRVADPVAVADAMGRRPFATAAQLERSA